MAVAGAFFVWGAKVSGTTRLLSLSGALMDGIK
jgi:hypothetical protein